MTTRPTLGDALITTGVPNPAKVTPSRHGEPRSRGLANRPLRGHVWAFVALLAATACEIPTLPAVAGDPIARATDTTAIITDRARPYPIHLYYLGDIHDVIREETRSAANEWARLLAPTPTAPFVFDTGVANSFQGAQGQFTFTYDPGDTLAPGLHVFVLTTPRNTRGWGLGGPSNLHKYGRSDAGTQPVGMVWFNWEAISELPTLGSIRGLTASTALHELGHVLGIGTSERWKRHTEVPDSTKPWSAFFSDSAAIAVFDKMGGTDFPWKKIPITGDGSHWDGCAGHYDIMGTHRNETSTVTELTLASLSKGFVYDEDAVPDRTLDRARWNLGDLACENGRWKGPS